MVKFINAIIVSAIGFGILHLLNINPDSVEVTGILAVYIITESIIDILHQSK